MEFRSDRLSNLPSDIMEKILLLLPIREAVRTSVLATKWKNRWAKLPQLVFNRQCASSQSHTSFVAIVDHALLVHHGPLLSFKLSGHAYLASRDIDRWIVHLSRLSIKEFHLKLSEQGLQPYQYKIPACLFSWQDIIQLWLTDCLLQPLPTFKGFKSLTVLCIVRVTLAQDVLVNLVCCSLLRKLIIVDCEGFTDLKIDAPELLLLFFIGRFDDINLQNTTNLCDVSIQKSNADRRRVPDNFGNMVLLFSQLPCVRELEIKGNFLQYLAPSVSPSKLPKPCFLLKLLTIEIHFNNPEEISTALCLLTSSPALQELRIVACTKDRAIVGDVNSRLDDNLIWSFTDLRTVKIRSISGATAELDFIRFLLSSSPVLRKMIIQPSSVSNSSELLKKLLRLSRASVHSEIIYLEK